MGRVDRRRPLVWKQVVLENLPDAAGRAGLRGIVGQDAAAR
jgi:hypothetical protein